MEYALVIGTVVAALVGTQAYIKRGIQGRLREAADSLGQQYEPKNTNSTSNLIINSNTASITKTLSENDLNTKYGTYIDLDQDGKTNGTDIFATETTTILGTWTDAGSKDGIPQSSEISGGSTTKQQGSETVGKL